MPSDKSRRMVVEEVGAPEPVVNTEPVEEIKEKVEELQNITENISDSVEKSANVQEEIAKAAEEVVPAETPVNPQPTYSPSFPSSKAPGPNPFVIIIPGFFLLGALLGGIFFYQKSFSGKVGPTSTPSSYDNMISSSPLAAPTPQANLDLSKYPINVMNGSGIAGQANAVKSILTSAGFTVSATGNASSYDFTKTVIKAKSDVPAAFITQLTATLSKSYVLDTNQSLATSSADEVEVIIGSTKAQ